MKKLIGLGSMAALSISAVNGFAIADPALDPRFSFYLGAHGGVVDGDALAQENCCNYPSDGTNGIMGLLGGVNVDMGSYFVGVEGDIGIYLDGELQFPGGNLTGIGELDWNGHLRGLVGTELGGVEIFAAGGLAIAEATFFEGSSRSTDVLYGWSAGIGVQGKVLSNASLRLEFIHDDYSNTDFDSQYSGNWTDNTVRGALIFELGGN